MENIMRQDVSHIVREVGIEDELIFWEQTIREMDLNSEYWKGMVDPQKPVDKDLARFLENRRQVSVLDVGCGPCSPFGKMINKELINLIGVDPLAEEYKKILLKHAITIPNKLIQGGGEELSSLFEKNTFDMVYSSNALDHSFDPVECIRQMVTVCKDDGFVCFDVMENEAISQAYSGLHQWNFTITNDQIIILNKSKAYLLSDVLQGLPYTYNFFTDYRVSGTKVIRVYIPNISKSHDNKIALGYGLLLSHNLELGSLTFITSEPMGYKEKFFVHFIKNDEIVDNQCFYWDTGHDMFSVSTSATEYNTITVGQFKDYHEDGVLNHERFWDFTMNLC